MQRDDNRMPRTKYVDKKETGAITIAAELNQQPANERNIGSVTE